MAFIQALIPNLIQGVSQQPDDMRMESQMAEIVNMYCSLVEGLTTRPPIEHVARLTSALGDCHTHWWDRDDNLQYLVQIGNGQLRAYNRATGAAITITTPDGLGYLTTSTPEKDIKCLSLGDYTFILNTATTVLPQATTASTMGSIGLCFVRQGEYASDYKIRVNGTEVASLKTSDTNKDEVRTNFIATDLATKAQTNLGSGYAVTAEGPVVIIRKLDGTSFTLETTDSGSNRHFYAIKDSIQSFTDLPTVGWNGQTIRIANSPDSDVDDYYVKFTTNSGSNSGRGVWVECPKPGEDTGFNLATMPHVLVRQADGSMVFRQGEWAVRAAGDVNSAPLPSFTNRKIQEIFYSNNRLGFLSDIYLVMSRAGEFFSFFRETARQVLDSDPIDIETTEGTAVSSYHAVPTEGGIVLFSEQAQAVVRGGETLTNKNVSCKPATAYRCDLLCEPVRAGKNIFFASQSNGFTNVREYFPFSDYQSFDAAHITEHCPQYIPGAPLKITCSTDRDTLFVLADGYRNRIYVNKYYWSQNEKVQNAWKYWTCGSPSDKILSIHAFRSTLLVSSLRNGSVFLETISLDLRRQDNGIGGITLLDRRLNETQATSSYSPVTGLTTWTLPWPIYNSKTGLFNPTVVTRMVTGGDIPGEVIPTQPGISNTQITAVGNHTNKKVWIGDPFDAYFTFSTFYPKQEKGKGTVSFYGGRIQIRTLTLQIARAFSLVVETLLPGGTRRTPLSGRVSGLTTSAPGVLASYSGARTVAIMGRNSQTKITVRNSSLFNLAITSASWEGEYVQRARLI